LHATGTLFLLAGWDGQNGHLVYKAPQAAGGEWSLISSRDGHFAETDRVPLGKGEIQDPTSVKFELRGKQLRLTTSNQLVGGRHTLPGYRPGHIVLGVADGRYGEAPFKIESLDVHQ